MNYREKTFLIDCQGDCLVSILTTPSGNIFHTGVVIVVGGPQYRVGSHRQFALLCRALATAGIACLRFDCRGMGDSEGEPRGFTGIGEDIRAAIDAFMKRQAGLSKIVLWGLCDGATASAFYASEDKRVRGLVLLNPWVRTDQTEAQAYIKHYYWQRLTSGAFWRKLIRGELGIWRSAREALHLVKRSVSAGEKGEPGSSSPNNTDGRTLPDRLYRSLSCRPIDALFLLSGKDLVASEFEDMIKGNESWSALLRHFQVKRLPDADHTFSDPSQTNLVSSLTLEWILSRRDQGASAT